MLGDSTRNSSEMLVSEICFENACFKSSLLE